MGACHERCAMGRLSDGLDIARRIVRVAYEQEVKYPAAALAYYAFVSFVPVVLIVFALFGERLAARVQASTPRFLTLGARQLVYEATTTATGRTGAAALAVVVLAWSAANVAVGFLAVVERVEDVPERPLRYQFRDAAVVLGSLVLTIVAIVFASTLFGTPGGTAAGLGSLVVALSAVFVPLYYVPSRTLDRPAAALPGAITAAVGLTVIHAGVHVYAVNAGRFAVYGVLSGIIVMLTSLYLASAVLLTGIIVNATVADPSVAPGDSRVGESGTE